MRKILIAAIALILVAGGWWYASPYWTLHQMQAAAHRGDSQGLSAYIDYPAVREDVESQLDQRMPHDCYSPDQCNGVSALATLIINPLIDRMVTPAGLQAAFAQRRKQSSPGKGPKLPGVPDRAVVDHKGLNSFTVRGRNTGGAFVFERYGLSWRLVGIELAPIRESSDKDA